MIERQRGKFDLLCQAGKFGPGYRARHLVKHRRIGKKRKDDDTLETLDAFRQLGHDRHAIDRLAAITITISCEQDFRMNLIEPVQHAVNAEIRRAR